MSKSKAPVRAAAVLMIVLAGCATRQTGATADAPQPVAAAKRPAAPVPDSAGSTAKANDRREDGEMIGTPASGSKFSRLKFGMSPQQVMSMIGAPNDSHTYETGRRWIPFYFGSDARRLETVYKGEGCLTFTGGNIYGSGDNALIVITVDPKGACFDS